MKKIFLFFVLLSVTTTAICQFKIEGDGSVKIGVNYPIVFRKGSTTTLTEIGSSVGYISFRNSDTDWLMLFAKQFLTTSDSVLKENILPLKNATIALKQVNTYSYYFKIDKGEARRKEYGVLAQEVEKVFPELVHSVNETKGVNYTGFIPYLIEAIKEQQNEIETLQKIVSTQEMDLIELQALRKMVNELQEIVYQYCGNSKNMQNMNISEEQQYPQGKAILYQNTPNPFSTNTEIVCHLPETTQHAMLYIYSLQGMELKSYPITQTGLNTITVNGSELPAGMYLYTLVIDNVIIDTKRMILTK
jgi:flagellar biosynthesis chaperone FliJ